MHLVGITGGTGLVGRYVTDLLQQKGYQTIIFTRNPFEHKGSNTITYARWDVEKQECDVNALGKVNAMIHLAGAGIAEKRWTAARKKEIVDSRVKGTQFLVSQLKQYSPDCKTFISASAIGFYGPDKVKEIPFKEDAPPYSDFLANTCVQWERASEEVTDIMRRVVFRIGIVLGKEGGAFPEFAGPMSFGIVPILGSGRQVVSWIHVADLAAMMVYALEQEKMSGVYNGVAPNRVKHRKLMFAIAKAKGGIKIPVPVPAIALKLLLGEMSEEVLKSCTVSADKIVESGFIFRYKEIDSAVKAVLNQ